jgi:hypothetical protein
MCGVSVALYSMRCVVILSHAQECRGTVYTFWQDLLRCSFPLRDMHGSTGDDLSQKLNAYRSDWAPTENKSQKNDFSFGLIAEK